MAAHGAQKAFGWWSGPGPDGWRRAVASMGFRPSGLWAAISTLAELIGGPLLGVGLFTPVAAAVLVGQCTVIIGQVHLPKGFWNRNSGYEFPLVLAAGAVAVALIGPGALSLDHLLGIAFDDAVRLGLVVVGALGGLAALMVPRVAARDEEAGSAR
ncbi:MAG: DoxX family protein [Actinobacteria bacterium]|nr:MAG: DoxX family protein [Actinomycetota bacterium]